MLLIVISGKDPASMNIRDRLLELESWENDPKIKFEGGPVHTFRRSALMVTISKYHLYYDHVDRAVCDELAKQGLEIEIKTVIFPSKHRSASGKRTLTVHPIGNFNKADYGGKPEELVPAAPYLMTNAYRWLRKHALKDPELSNKYSVTFEATHHGPYLATPSFFIEIGSDEEAWADETAAKAIATTLMKTINREDEDEAKDFPVAIGIGGGHYTPRHSDVARKKCVNFGHIIPTYALDGLPRPMLSQVIARTPDASLVYFHRKALNKEQYRTLKDWYDEQGLKVVRSDDLNDLDEKHN